MTGRSRSRDTPNKDGCPRPRCSLLSFTIFFSLGALMCQAMREYIVSQITSLEKQFGLSSTRSGVLAVSEDIGYLLTILFIGHFGRHGHIPRILGTSIVVLGLSGTMSGLSYFFSPDTLPSGDLDLKNATYPGRVCVNGSQSSDWTCGQDGGLSTGTRSNSWVVGLLTALGILQGVAHSSTLALGSPFIEDNATSKSQSTLFNGIMLVLNYLGSAVALGLGSVVSTIPLDLKETELSPGHPQWIAAWWLGYLALGALSILVAIPLFFYPRVLLRPREHRNQKEALQVKTEQTLKEKIIDLPKCLYRLLKNPVFVLMNCGNCLLALFLAGSMAFDPKYVETQFMVPAFQANYIVGGVGLLVLIVGTLGGAIIASKLKMNNQESLKFSIVSMTVGMALFLLLLLFGCETPNVTGLGEVGLNSSLSADCVCDITEYFPLCGEDGKSYKSPCFAGCTNRTDITYSSCEGIPGGGGKSGLCETECNYLYYYVGVEALSGILGTFPIVAIYMTMIRCVDADDKAMAMAVTSFVTTLLGFFPAPILYGALIDSACQIWGQSCDGKGACARYDLRLLRTRVKGCDVGFQLCALLMYIMAYSVYRFKHIKNKVKNKTDAGTAMEVLHVDL